MRRALVVRIGALGDLILTRRLTYSLSLAGFRSTLFAPARHVSLLLADPWIEAVLDSESPRFAPVFSGAWPEAGDVFDIALVISNSPGLAEAAGLAAATVIRVSPEPWRNGASIARQWAERAGPFCEPFFGALPRLGTSEDRALVPGASLIHPGSGSPRKNWPVERFIELSRRLGASGHQVAWILGPAEADLPADVPSSRMIVRPSLEALAATLARSTLFIGNDSGVSHLAAAVGAFTLTLFGPTNAAVWRPDGPRVRVVRAESGSMKDIPVETVLAAAGDLARLGTTAP